MPKPSVESVQAVSKCLLLPLVTLIAIILISLIIFYLFKVFALIPLVMALGALGAFISLQRRLKKFSENDLKLFINSKSYTWLAPIAGATLAGVLYLIFVWSFIAGYSEKSVTDIIGRFESN